MEDLEAVGRDRIHEETSNGNKINMYTVKDLQEILHIGKGTAYKIIKTKGFPTIQIGKKILIPEDDLRKWLKDNIETKINL